MRHKSLLFVLVLLLMVHLALPVSATLEGFSVIDDAELLSDQQHIELESMADHMKELYGSDVLIVTTASTYGKTPQEYAESLCDPAGLGWWNVDSSILLLISMEDRDWYISTTGDAIYVFTDYGLEQISEVMLPDLSAGNYYSALVAYLNALPEYFEAFTSGSPIDGYASDYHPYKENVIYYEESASPSFLLSVIIGVIAAAISILIMRSSMNTKRKQHSASDYLSAGSFHLHTQRDIFLYSNITKTRRQENNTSSSRGGGGSSVHRSSSGRTHGGRGGKF